MATVLVVDDEEPIRTLAKAALESFGYRVLLAEDGREALDLLGSKADVDLVVLDLIMPAPGGANTFSEMRKRWPSLAILVVTGSGRHEAHQLGIPGDLPLLEKPYTIQMLADAVDQAVRASAGPEEATMNNAV